MAEISIKTKNSFADNENTHDPILGSIKISAFEMRLINTPEFQRLRRIKQLGFVNLVYPAAEHSRFVHSIGVCHHSKKLVDQVNENFKREARYRIWRNNGINAFIDAPSFETVKITEVERIIISAAALLHDLPHSPFSHEIESPNNNPLTGIPNHDEFEKNPVLFKYLFDIENSRLAQIIDIYNDEFWSLLQSDNHWFERIRKYIPNLIDGYVYSSEGSIIFSSEQNKYKKLPILGVMIFELHLFEKPEHWVEVSDTKDPGEAAPRKVETEWDDLKSEDSIINWKPIKGWFRPYRKDIVGNTICADLIDYIDRDGRQTGIISSIDLKFLDRMTISRAIPDKTKPTKLKILWDNIPDYCEHIIFDIYDHKRGFIRDSVITEILSCLQARYQLTERVYNHRVVEGARSMLQEISRLLCSIELLNIKTLHTYDENHANNPTGDDTFLEWVIDLKQKINKQASPEIKRNILAAVKLAIALKERRIYREAVIIDGIHGYNTGSLSGSQNSCEALVDILLSDNTKISNVRLEMINKISDRLRECYTQATGNSFNEAEQLATIGARKFGNKYKVPRVLVAKPFSNTDSRNNKIDIQPLFACEDPPHIKIQLDAMKTAYNSLWRIYLFIHPSFHWDKRDEANNRTYIQLHDDIEKIFLAYTNKETPVDWKNSIDFSKLLPKEPIDYVEYINDKRVIEAKVISDQAQNVVIEDDSEMDKIINDLLLEIFDKSPKDTSKASPLKLKEYQDFTTLVKKDSEMLKYISDRQRRDLLIQKIPMISHTIRRNYSKNVYDFIKIIVNEEKQKGLF